MKTVHESRPHIRRNIFWNSQSEPYEFMHKPKFSYNTKRKKNTKYVHPYQEKKPN